MRFIDYINGEKPVLVDFTAAWCGPCQTMKPLLDQLKQKMGSSITILKIDIDKNPQAAAHYGIQGVPTFIIFKQGKQLWRQSGAMPMTVLESQLKQYV